MAAPEKYFSPLFRVILTCASGFGYDPSSDSVVISFSVWRRISNSKLHLQVFCITVVVVETGSVAMLGPILIPKKVIIPQNCHPSSR